MGVLGVIACYGAGAWVLDVVLRPLMIRDRALAAAKRRGKPVLNIGAGTPGSSIRVSILGPTMWGDVNCDIAGAGECAPDHVCYCDAHNIPYSDKHFGAVIASHVLEHVDDPALVLREMHRVADEVFVVVPRWWGIHTWIQPEHRWYVTKDFRFLPLWQQSLPQQQGCSMLSSINNSEYPVGLGR